MCLCVYVRKDQMDEIGSANCHQIGPDNCLTLHPEDGLSLSLSLSPTHTHTHTQTQVGMIGYAGMNGKVKSL